LSRLWRGSGAGAAHYARTANDRLDNFDSHRDEIEPILRPVCGRYTAYGCGADAGSFCDPGLFVYADGSKWGREPLSNGRR